MAKRKEPLWADVEMEGWCLAGGSLVGFVGGALRPWGPARSD